MVDIYLNLLRAYPQIKALTNPFRTEESKIWIKLRECLNSLEENPHVEICSTTYSWKLESGFRLSAAPTIAAMAKYFTFPPDNIENDDRMLPFAASDIISFNGAFESQTDYCVLKDIAEAVIWAKGGLFFLLIFVSIVQKSRYKEADELLGHEHLIR